MSEITLNVIHRAEDNSRYCAYVCRKVSDEIKRLINVRAIVAELWHVAIARGMTTLVQDGVEKSSIAGPITAK